MQWIGETIDAPITGSLDTDLDHVAAPFGRDLLHVLHAMRDGDFSVRMAGGHDGLSGQIAEAVNVIAAANQRLAQQLERAGEEIGRDGRTPQRIKVGLPGGWGGMEDQLNRLVDNLLWPAAAVTRAVAAVAKGDLTQTVALDIDGRPLKGDFLQAATAVNAMIHQLGLFAAEITRVGREIGTEGRLGAQVQAGDAAGVWKVMTDSVNAMARTMSAHIRNVTDVTAAVANGDFSKKMVADVRGETRQLKDTVNAMVDQLRCFAAEVTRAVRAMGEDRPGSRTPGSQFPENQIPENQVDAAGAADAWKDLAGCVDQLAAALAAQLHAVAEERKEAEDRQALLAREVDHRTKNALAVVHAVVSLTRAEDIGQFSAAVEGRIQALARAHSLLSDSRWRGAGIADLVKGELAPLTTAGPERIRMSGGILMLHPSAVQALALTVHELAANAARHGALSLPSGSVHVAWEQQGEALTLRWSERGAPIPQLPAQSQTQDGPADGLVDGLVPILVQEGLGMRIIRASVETQLCGRVEFDWRPEGLDCVIRVPCHPKIELFGNFLYSIQNAGAERRRQA
jgi:two-component sensor histidine kinase/HAMP domain-containing protein